MLDTLTARVVVARIDFSQHSETYYFQEEDPRFSLARQVQVAVRIRTAAAECPSQDVQLGGIRLGTALDGLATTLGAEFVPSAEDGDVFTAYATDHGRRPAGSH